MKIKSPQTTPTPATAQNDAPARTTSSAETPAAKGSWGAPSTSQAKGGWAPKKTTATAAPATVAKPAAATAHAPAAVKSQAVSAGASLASAPNLQGLDAVLDEETHSTARPGNKVTMLFDGVNSFAERDKMIDGAKESICLQTFIFNSDDTGWALARKLAGKAQEGVQVRVIYDGMGSNRADPKMFDLMRQAGVEVREYADPLRDPTDLNARWHEKHLIVDGRASVEGGMNIANEYALGGSEKLVFSRGKQGKEAWRDTDAKLEGPAVNDAMQGFLKNWKSVGGQVSDADRAKLLPAIAPRADGASVRVVRHHPNDDSKDSNTLKMYQRSIEKAQKSITIENAYFLPPPEIRKALIDAAKRGVEVKVMTNSRASNDSGFVSDAARYFYDDLIAAGVKIYEKQGGTLHAKTATFDGNLSIVGSVNLNGRSNGRDSEDALLMQDAGTAKQLEQRFATGLRETRPVTADDLKQESFFTNLKQWALSTLAWTF